MGFIQVSLKLLVAFFVNAPCLYNSGLLAATIVKPLDNYPSRVKVE